MQIEGNAAAPARRASHLHTTLQQKLIPPVLQLSSKSSAASNALQSPRRFIAEVLRRSASVVCPALLLLMVASPPTAWSAVHPSGGVVEALQRKYKVTATTPDSEQITRDGTTMSLQCAGIYTLPTGNIVEPDNKVVNGKIQSPSMLAKLTLTKMGSHVLQNGDKVYVTKIETRGESGDTLRFTILTADSLDVSGQDQQKRYKAVISFKFKKGYLDDAPPEDVEQAIEAIVAPDAGSDNSQNADNSGGQGQAQAQGQAQPAPPAPPQRAAAPAPPPPAPAGPPPTITIGESSTQVLQAMGMPLQMIDLGRKKTYVYKNMKVIFVDDKVTDVD